MGREGSGGEAAMRRGSGNSGSGQGSCEGGKAVGCGLENENWVWKGTKEGCVERKEDVRRR